MPKQRLVVMFDGTWSDPQDRTNVFRLVRQLSDRDGSTQQRFFYDPGVSTDRLERLRGGVFGRGLTENLLQGYDWLARNYATGDEIWLFGFSRGAYTTRSLVGLINKCGLLDISTPDLLEQAEALYRNKSLSADSPECKAFRERYSRKVKVHFLGVWDTVGTLGVPGTFKPEQHYAWQDTTLSGLVERAYHAVALDEYRRAFDVALWTSADGKMKPGQVEVEQRWFIGSHANVGGGYGDDPLADISFAWMLGKAARAGLAIKPFAAPADAWRTELRDSYSEFLGGAYSLWSRFMAMGDGRQTRSLYTGQGKRPAINVTIDDSVWMRRNAPECNYRPAALEGWVDNSQLVEPATGSEACAAQG